MIINNFKQRAQYIRRETKSKKNVYQENLKSYIFATFKAPLVHVNKDKKTVQPGRFCFSYPISHTKTEIGAITVPSSSIDG